MTTEICLENDEIKVYYSNKFCLFPKIPNKDSKKISFKYGGKAYLNTFSVGEVENVKLKYMICVTWMYIIYGFFITGFFIESIVTNKNGMFLNLAWVLLFLLFTWLHTIKVIEITLKNKHKVSIPVFGYMFPIFDEERKQEIYNAYETLRNLIK